MADPAARAKAVPCAPAGDGSACARQLIETLGRRAFRRPLTGADMARFETLFTRRAELTPTGSFNDVAQLIIQAFLVSPSFLTRAEIAEVPAGQYLALNSYEIASRLSYMIWGSMPDEPLFAAAHACTLSTPQGIMEHARRLLADPKAHGTVRAFHESYLHMGDGTRWTSMQRDPALYPAFNPALIPLLSEETTRFVDHMVFDRRGSFADLITAPVAFVNAALAPMYGLNPANFGPQLTKVDLDPASRAGLLTRAGFLTAYALYNRSSPILRGAYIQKTSSARRSAHRLPTLSRRRYPRQASRRTVNGQTPKLRRHCVRAATIVRSDLDSFKRLNMSGGDRKKVDDWLGLLRETETAVVSSTCDPNSATALGIDTNTVNQSGGGFDMGAAFTRGGDMMIKLMALTTMCDANRVTVLHWPGYATFTWDGMAHKYDHHGLSHRNGSAAIGGTCIDGVIENIQQIDTWYTGRYLKLVTLFDSIKEGDGTLLDHSAVMWLPELADGNVHNNNNLPIVIAGSMGGYLKQGVSVNLEGARALGTGNSEASCTNGVTDIGFGTGSQAGNVPINKLYVTLLNGLGATDNGAPITRFGVADSKSLDAGITNPGELAALRP